MSKQSHPSEQRIQKFKSDVSFLEAKGISRTEIANKMPGVGSGNFSNYFNENHSITNGFLNKFYKTWKAQLDDEGHTQEENGNYQNEYFLVQQLMAGQDNIIKAGIIKDEAFKTAAEANKIAAEANKILAESNKHLVETHKQLIEDQQKFIERLLDHPILKTQASIQKPE